MKIKLVILLIVISSSFSYAQILNSIGFKGGVSLSNHNWNDTFWQPYFNFTPIPSFYGVISAEFVNKEHWNIMTDLGVYQSGSNVDFNPNAFSYYSLEALPGESKFTIGFITFSPVIKLKTQINRITPFIFIGPRVDYYYSNLNKNDINYYFDGITKKPIWGFNIGEGFCYRIKRFSIIAEYKFLYSFTYLIDKPHNIAFPDIPRDQLKTTTHVISIGLKYHFNKKETSATPTPEQINSINN
ncbi:MAG: outer membrane beta-barrel protein [Bacteroidota bacterium]